MYDVSKYQYCNFPLIISFIFTIHHYYHHQQIFSIFYKCNNQIIKLAEFFSKSLLGEKLAASINYPEKWFLLNITALKWTNVFHALKRDITWRKDSFIHAYMKYLCGWHNNINAHGRKCSEENMKRATQWPLKDSLFSCNCWKYQSHLIYCTQMLVIVYWTAKETSYESVL